jgi:CheY-like chemotaxis protein
MRLDDKPFGLKAMCEEAVQGSAALAKQGQVELDLRGGEVFVKGDRERLSEAVTHALEHAIFVSPRGSTVKVEVGADDTGQARVSVTDQGPPVPEADLEHLFDTLARSSGGSRRTDLGLSIAARIVRLHGGRVAARAHPVPEPKPSSPLRVVGPAHRDATTIELLLQMYAGAVAPTGLSQAPRPGGILLVEDDADCREVLRDVLEQEGYRVISASSAAEARSVLTNIRPALVLLDIHLRDEDGRTVLHDIRRNPALAEVPVFIISGASNLGSLTSESGLDRIEGFLEKPIQLSRLLDTVASAVTPRRSPAS